MSDFIGGFWSHYVTYLSLASIAACVSESFMRSSMGAARCGARGPEPESIAGGDC